MESRYTRIESFGRYAPAVGFFFADEGQRLANGLDPILTGTLADGDIGTGPENPGPNGMIDPARASLLSTALWATVLEMMSPTATSLMC